MFEYECPTCRYHVTRVCWSKRNEDRATHEARCNPGRREEDRWPDGLPA